MNLLTDTMLPAIKSEELAEFCDCFCEAGYFTLEDAALILRRAGELGMRARVHADQLTRCGGAELAASVFAATADHLEQADSDAIAALKGARVQPVLLPGSVYALGKTKYPPAREMIEAGLEVVLATDFNPGSSPTPSIPMVLSLACTQMKMTPAEAVTAATVNAAYSLGWGGEIGSIEPGKIADFVIYDCQDYREIAYWFGVNLVKEVWASGMLVHQHNVTR
jgi:imidazolonepropionase